jgi:hypothetical protein
LPIASTTAADGGMLASQLVNMPRFACSSCKQGVMSNRSYYSWHVPS